MARAKLPAGGLLPQNHGLPPPAEPAEAPGPGTLASAFRELSIARGVCHQFYRMLLRALQDSCQTVAKARLGGFNDFNGQGLLGVAFASSCRVGRAL